MRNVLNTLTQVSIPYIFIVSFIGIGGNILLIIMLLKRSLSKNFNNCTLIALALTDLIFNATLVSRCVHDIIELNSEQLCRLLSFLSHLAELLSACLTAHFTAQRYIAVRFPLSVLIEKKVHRLHYIIVIICIIFSTIYCLALVDSNSYDNCHEELELKWFISDALLSFFIPFIIITILNTLIIYHLKKSIRNNQQYRFTNSRLHSTEMIPLSLRKKSLSINDIQSPTNTILKINGYVTIPKSKTNLSLSQSIESKTSNTRARSLNCMNGSSTMPARSQSRRVTRMLIIVSTSFLLLNAPAHICTIGFKIYTLQNPIAIENSIEINYDTVRQSNQTFSSTIIDRSSSDHLHWIQSFYIIIIITQHLAYASYSINFFLYSFCGIKFRGELIRCMSNRRRYISSSRSITIQNM